MRGWRGVIVFSCVLLLAASYAGYVGVRVAVIGDCLEQHLPFGLADTRLVTRPYLQNVTATSAALLWWTEDAIPATIRHGIAPALTETRELDAARRQEAVLTGLRPDTTYAYEVTIAGTPPIVETFRTAPDRAATVTFGVIGDSGAGGVDQTAIADLLTDLSLDVIVHTGDVVYPRGGICDYRARFFAPYQDLLATTPIYPAIGNHDLDSEQGRAFFDVFMLPGEDEETGAFYTVEYGPARLIILDGEALERGGGANREATRRLDEIVDGLDQDATRPVWTILVVHRPPVSWAGDSPMNARVAGDLFFRFTGRADLILSGHLHAYVRGEGLGDIPLVITGGGGAALHAVPPSEEIAVARSVHHALRLTVSPIDLHIEAFATDGTVFDRVVLSVES